MKRIPRKNIIPYLKEILKPKEIRNPFLYLTCPHCKNIGEINNSTCPVCEGKRFINPKKYISKEKRGDKMTTVRQAIQAIDSRCDGAVTEDGQGFNKFDTRFANSLLNQSHWTEDQEKAAYNMLEKYKVQLKSIHNIEYDKLKFEYEGEKKEERGPMLLETDDKGRLLLDSYYEFKDKAKAIPHSRWLPAQKRWRYLPKTQTCLQLMKYIGEGKIEVTEEANEILNGILEKYEKRQEKLERVKRIKRGETIEIKPPPLNYELFDHQKKAFKISYTLNQAALLMEQGTGKTLSAIATTGKRYLDDNLQRVLVICPKSVIQVWEEEFNKHAKFPFEVKQLIGPVSERKEMIENWKQDNDKLQIAVINYESTWRMEDTLMDWEPEQVILDESQKIKNGTTKQAKACHKFKKCSKYRMILTGTPVTQTPLDFHSQYKFLNTEIFGTSFYKFKKKYAIMGGYGGYEIKGYRNLEELAEKAHNIAYRVTKDEALDLPETIDQNLYCDLSEKSKKYYKEMEEEFFITIGDDEVTAPIILTKLLRLQQITGGFIPTEEGKIIETNSEKLILIKEFLEDYNKDKLIIFARFKPEIKAIKEVSEKAGYTTKTLTGDTEDRGKLINNFQNEKDPQVLIIQVQTGGLGITLTATDTVIFYSMNFSYADYEQAKARVHRIGQNKTVNYIHFITKDTVDEDIMQALIEKRDIADLVVDKYNKNKPRKEVKDIMTKEDKSDKNLSKRMKRLKGELEKIEENGLEEGVESEKLNKVINNLKEEPAIKKEIEEEKSENKEGKKKRKKEDTELSGKGTITPKMLADKYDYSATTVRRKLRDAGIEKPSSRWKWPEDHPDLEKIKDILSD